MDLETLDLSYKQEAWKEILPDVLIGFGLIIPLLLAGAWVAHRQESDSDQAGNRFDRVAALALFAWLGYFVGHRFVFLMDRPDRWVVGALLGATFFTILLLLPKARSTNAGHNAMQGQDKTTGQSRYSEAIQAHAAWSKYLASELDFGGLARQVFLRTRSLFQRAIPFAARGLAVFFLSSSTATYWYLTSHKRIVITLVANSNSISWPQLQMCYLGQADNIEETEPSSHAGTSLAFRVTDLGTRKKRVTLWLDGSTAKLVGAEGWLITILASSVHEPAKAIPIDVPMRGLTTKLVGWLNIPVYEYRAQLYNLNSDNQLYNESAMP